jgi:hypothetical protein
MGVLLHDQTDTMQVLDHTIQLRKCHICGTCQHHGGPGYHQVARARPSRAYSTRSCCIRHATGRPGLALSLQLHSNHCCYHSSVHVRVCATACVFLCWMSGASQQDQKRSNLVRYHGGHPPTNQWTRPAKPAPHTQHKPTYMWGTQGGGTRPPPAICLLHNPSCGGCHIATAQAQHC